MSRAIVHRFDSAAAGHARRRAGEASFRLQVSAALDLVPAVPERALDLGCGSGPLGERMGAGAKGLVGLDLSPAMLGEARRRGLAVARGDAARLPFRDGAFDAVLSLGLLEYVPDPGAVAAEVARVLRPGGTAVLTWPNARAPARLWLRLFPRRMDQDLARRLSVRRVAGALGAAGLETGRVRTANAAVLPWPADSVLPGLARFLARALEPLTRRFPLALVGTQFVLAARKPPARQAVFRDGFGVRDAGSSRYPRRSC